MYFKREVGSLEYFEAYLGFNTRSVFVRWYSLGEDLLPDMYSWGTSIFWIRPPTSSFGWLQHHVLHLLAVHLTYLDDMQQCKTWMHRRAIYDTSQEGEQGKHKATIGWAQALILNYTSHKVTIVRLRVTNPNHSITCHLY